MATAAAYAGARRVSRRARLGPVQERRLVLAAKARPGNARGDLIDAFEPSIASVARLYRRSAPVEQMELMQEGVVGLLRALERYDATLGTPFWTYAAWWVRQAMQGLVSELARPVVLSDRAERRLARVRGAQREHVRRHGRAATADDVAAKTGLTRTQIDDLVAVDRRPRALEERLHGEEGADVTFGDLLADPVAHEAYDRLPARVSTDELHRLLGTLCDRELTIIRARFGLDGPEQTLRELGATLDISVERVRQLEERALDRLRVAVGVATGEKLERAAG
jgi:RNA polymerase primary sigma factor